MRGSIVEEQAVQRVEDIGVDRETFDQQIAEQRKKIEERLGRKVKFDVQIEDDKVRVVAKKKKTLSRSIGDSAAMATCARDAGIDLVRLRSIV